MNTIKTNTSRFLKNNFLQKSLRIVLVYSILYLNLSLVITDNSFSTQKFKNEFILSVSQNSIEFNLSERTQRLKAADQNRFSVEIDAVCNSLQNSNLTEYFITNAQYSVDLILLLCNSNHLLRAPPKN